VLKEIAYFNCFKNSALHFHKHPPSLHELMQTNCEDELEIIRVIQQMKINRKNHYLDICKKNRSM